MIDSELLNSSSQIIGKRRHSATDDSMTRRSRRWWNATNGSMNVSSDLLLWRAYGQPPCFFQPADSGFSIGKSDATGLSRSVNSSDILSHRIGPRTAAAAMAQCLEAPRQATYGRPLQFSTQSVRSRLQGFRSHRTPLTGDTHEGLVGLGSILTGLLRQELAWSSPSF